MKKSAIRLLLTRVISFSPVLAQICEDNIDNAIFLSQALYWSERTHDGWFYKSGEEWHQETRMRRRAQERARDCLKRLGFVEEKLCGSPATLHFKVNFEILEKSLHKFARTEQTSLYKPSSQFVQTEQTGLSEVSKPYKEAEITTEIKHRKNPLPPLEKQTPSAEDQKPIELDLYSAARSLGELIGSGHSGGRGLHRLTSAIEQAERRWKDKSRLECIAAIVDLWKEYCAQGHHAPVAIHNWLESVGSYIDSDHWRKKKKPEFKPEIDWQGGHIDESGVYINKHGKKVPGFICPPKPKQMAGD